MSQDSVECTYSVALAVSWKFWAAERSGTYSQHRWLLG